MIPLPPDLVQTIQQSCRPLLDQQVQFEREFHASLVELMPDVAMMSEPVGVQISQSMVSCVFWAVFAQEPEEVIAATLQRVGLDAYRLGFPRAGYQAVGHALLRSVRTGYYEEWSGNLSSSWIGYYSWLCEHWVYGADTGTFEDQSQPQTAPQAVLQQHAPGSYLPPVVERPPVASAADEEDDEEEEVLSYGEIMVSMTLGSNRASRWRERRKRAAAQELEDDQDL
jgi:hypothetical protein